MATATFTTPIDATNVVTDAENYARIVKIIRNMDGFKRLEDKRVVEPARTISNPSPLKKAASNRHPGQTHTRTEIDGAMNHELATARFLMQDLADHIFGHIIPTKLARDILQEFVRTKVVQVFDGAGTRGLKFPLDPESDDAQRAIQQAFEHTDRYGCTRDIQSGPGEPGSSSTSSTGKGKQKEKEKTYSFRWTAFPTEPLQEDELVSFLNDITDRAFAFAKPRLGVANQELLHRFAAPEDKHHAVPLSYEPDGQDMRPDFLLLPIEAFSSDFKTVDPKYVNFTASRLAGESKNKDLAAGIEQMQRYARGLKRAQPWVYYVLGMTITKDKAIFMRGEGSGTERLELMLTDGRGCIEFIRILLGLALADKVELGHNPDVELQHREQACKALNVTRRSKASTSKGTSRRPGNEISVPNALARVQVSKNQPAIRARSDPVAFSSLKTQSSSTKRDISEVSDRADQVTRSKKRKTEECTPEDVNRFVFYPIAVYGYECLGILFTASSIRGRATTVFCVADLECNEKRLALKMAWQDVTRVAEQDAVMQRLAEHGHHPNVIVPIKTEKIKRDDEVCTTLGKIRGFLDIQIEQLGVENRVLTLSASELKRPVKYFWGVHDFVRGLRGALLGHEYLTKIGILHRDISENNIVLGLRPEDERGYLIDLDMAILQNAEEPTQPEPIKPLARLSKLSARKSSSHPEPDSKKPMRALRTGTFPYISYNVLAGGKHTQFDDVESFLYVLFLFFFSYAGPLPTSEIRMADEADFVQPIGSGRPPHMINWPKRFAAWADGDIHDIAAQKQVAITRVDRVTGVVENAEFLNCLENNWSEELHDPICVLILNAFALFYNSTLRTAAKESRTEVTHAEFVDMLDEWLSLYSDLEDKFSNCPYKQSECEVTCSESS